MADHRYRFETGGCPIEAALDALGGRWKGLLLFKICMQTRRFHELRKTVPHISQRMLVRQLRELERDGLVTRAVALGVPAKVEYSPTAAAVALQPLLLGLRDWAAYHMMGMPAGSLSARSQPFRSAAPKPGARRQPVLR